MSYCTDCIHYKVCGNEGVDDSAMTFCADKKTSGDLISTQEAIDIVVFECGEWTGLAKEISKQLKQLPSAEQTAEWIDSKDVIEITQEIQHHYMCSKCGMYFDRMTKYCPNCGSRMKEK